MSRCSFKLHIFLFSCCLLVASGCPDSATDPTPCPLDAALPEDASRNDAAVPDDASLTNDAATPMDATLVDAQQQHDAAIEAATDDDSGGDAEVLVGYVDDSCDDACGEEQACMRQGDRYVCIDCFLRGSTPRPAAPAEVTLTTVEQALAVRGYRYLSLVTVPRTPAVADILENLVCLEWVTSLTVVETNDLRGLRNLQGGAVIELFLSPMTRDTTAPAPTLDGLGRLERVSQSLRIAGSGVNSLHGLEALVSVGGDFTLSVSEVTTLAPLESLTTVGGTFTVAVGATGIDAPALEHVGGLAAYSDALTSLEGLPPVNGSYTTLTLLTPNLTSTAPLAGLRHVTGDVYLAPTVPFDGLQDLRYVDGSVTLGQVCRPFRAPPGLRAIGGNLSINGFVYPPRGGVLCIEGGDTLSDLSQLRSIGGTLGVYYSGLESFDGLDQLEHLGGLMLYENPGLTRIDALRNVRGVMLGDVRVQANHQLTSLHGLEGVTDLGGRLLINWNNTFASLDGLSGLTSLGRMLSIGGNPMLPNCEVDALVQQISPSCVCDSPNLLPCHCSEACECHGNDATATCSP